MALLMPLVTWAANPATRPSPRRLIAQQSPEGDAVWLAEVTATPDGDHTVVWERADGQSLWYAVAEIPAAVQELAAAGGRLAALLSSGQWQDVNLTTGQPLPSGARLISLAADAETLLALGRVASPATVPSSATAPSPASTQASTAGPSLPPGLHLFRLQRGAWQHVAALPPGVDGEPGRNLSLASAERKPTIVTVGPSLTIDGSASMQLTAWQWHNDRWNRRSQWTAPAAISAIHAFDSLDCVAVWTAADNHLGQVHVLVGDGDGHDLNLSGHAAVRAVNQIAGMIRLYYVDGDKIMERRFDPRKLTEDGAATELRLVRLGEEPPHLKWVQGGLLALLVLAMGSAMMRRGKQQIKIDFKKLQLAPLGKRLLAGSIDAIPLIVGMMWVVSHYPQSQFRELQELYRAPDIIMQGWLVMGIYLAILTATEVLFGRSVGKMLTGLRVLRLDGASPGAVAMFVRNFLRVIDLGMTGVTLVLILMLPLRQRIGDIAAGTVVVADIPAPQDELGDDDVS